MSLNLRELPENVICVGISGPSVSQYTFPLFGEHIAAGFPSPADSYTDEPLDLNSYLVENPNATYFVKVSGESMTGAGIFPDDMLVVDRSLEPKSGDIVIAVVDGEFTVKRLAFKNGAIELRPENPAFRTIRLFSESNLEIWGVVRYTIRKV